MKKFLLILFTIYIYPLKIIASKNIDMLMRSLCKVLKTEKYFLSYRIRQIKPSNENPIIDNFCNGVILQGLIISENEFTVETVKL